MTMNICWNAGVSRYRLASDDEMDQSRAEIEGETKADDVEDDDGGFVGQLHPPIASFENPHWVSVQ